MSTISKVAERAGVSAKTVSRVMNNYAHISDKTRRKVEAALLELSYASGRTEQLRHIAGSRSVGVLYGDPSGGYQTRLNHALLEACTATGHYIISGLFDESRTDWRAQVEAFLTRTNVKNLILVPPMCDSSDIHRFLQSSEVQFVLISPSRPVSGASAVSIDDRLAAVEVTNHLIELGHKRLGHIAGQEGHVATILRLQGVQEAMEMAGLDFESCLVERGDFSFKKAIPCAERMLTAPDRPTAIFAANDEMAAAVLMVAHRLGIKVPEELAVVGFDDLPMSRRFWPELTTVSQPYDEMAVATIALLSGVRRGNAPETLVKVLPHRLIMRGSTYSVDRARSPKERTGLSKNSV